MPLPASPLAREFLGLGLSSPAESFLLSESTGGKALRRRCATPEQVRVALEAENIEARPLWKPMHMQPVFAGCQVRGGEVAESLFARGLCLPSGSNLTDADRQRIVATIRRVAARGGHAKR